MNGSQNSESSQEVKDDNPSDPSTDTLQSFDDFDLHEDVKESLKKMGISTPTPIQSKVIAPILNGKDVIGKAETGTGKTIGFGCPLIGKIDTSRVAIQALVLTPTRELAQQVSVVLEQLGQGRDLKVALVVGGVHASEQIIKLRSGSQVVVGTPGRVLDFLNDRTMSLSWCDTLIVDEADRMFDMGFIDDIRKIFSHLPKERQTLFFSATIPPDIKKLMKEHMKNPETYSTASGHSTVTEIKQICIEIEFPRKFEQLKKVLDEHPEETCIIFTNTRRQAIDLDRMLWGHNYPARALHGDHDQEVRFQVLSAFRDKDIRILVATDVASRGLDIENVGLVINYEIPTDVDSYVHRIGRTGRANRSGIAWSFVSRKEQFAWKKILEVTGFEVEQQRDPKSRRSSSSRRGDSASSDDGGRSRSRDGRRRSRRRGGERNDSASSAETTNSVDSPSEDRSSRRNKSRRRRNDRKPDSSSQVATQQEDSFGEGLDLETNSKGDSSQKSRRESRSSNREETSKSSRREDRPRSRNSRDRKPSNEGSSRSSRRESRDSRRRPRQSETKYDMSVDLFDVSMKDFLDVSRSIDEFKEDKNKSKSSGNSYIDTAGYGFEADKPAEAEESQDSSSSSSRDNRRRRGRRPQRDSEAEIDSAASTEEGENSADSEEKSSSRSRRRRRRRPRGRARGSEETTASDSVDLSNSSESNDGSSENERKSSNPRRRRRRGRGRRPSNSSDAKLKSDSPSS